jgi:hypothetical protein
VWSAYLAPIESGNHRFTGLAIAKVVKMERAGTVSWVRMSASDFEGKDGVRIALPMTVFILSVLHVHRTRDEWTVQRSHR